MGQMLMREEFERRVSAILAIPEEQISGEHLPSMLEAVCYAPSKVWEKIPGMILTGSNGMEVVEAMRRCRALIVGMPGREEQDSIVAAVSQLEKRGKAA